MRKLLPFLILLIAIIGIALWAVKPHALADVGMWPTPGGTIDPGDKTDKVEMTKEEVIYDVKKIDQDSPFYEEKQASYYETYEHHYAHVTASFEMTSASTTDETMDLIFPIPTGGASLLSFEHDAPYNPTRNFKILVNDAEVPFEYIPYILRRYEGSTYNVVAIKFSVTFKAGEMTKIVVEYDEEPVNEPKSMYRTFEYIMETGSHWKGEIGSGKVIFKFAFDIIPAAFRTYNDVLTFSTRGLTWSFENLEPSRDHDIKISYAPDLIKIWNEREVYMEEISASGFDGVIFDWKQFPTGYGHDYYEGREGNPIYLLPTGGEHTREKGDDGWIVRLDNSQTPWVLYEFSGVYEVAGITLTPGILVTGYKETGESYTYHSNGEPQTMPLYSTEEKGFYNMLSRPKKIKLTFSDGSTTELDLDDTLGEEFSAEFAKVETSSIKIEILDTYPNHAGANEYLGIARTSFDVGARIRDKDEEADGGVAEDGKEPEEVKSWFEEHRTIVIPAGIAATVAIMGTVAAILIKRG